MFLFLLLSILCPVNAASNGLKKCSQPTLTQGQYLHLLCGPSSPSLNLNDCYANGQSQDKLEYKPHGNAFADACHQCTLPNNDYTIRCDCRHDGSRRMKEANLSEHVQYEQGNLTCLPPVVVQSYTPIDSIPETTLRKRVYGRSETAVSLTLTVARTATAIAKSGLYSHEARGSLENLAANADAIWKGTPGLWVSDVVELIQGPFYAKCTNIALQENSFLVARCIKSNSNDRLLTRLDLNDCFEIEPYAEMKPASRYVSIHHLCIIL
ncbi:hypothetical protein BDV26DRAFT_152936 [Aspergillus bertholletiae]|uniref:Cyanovirin-N domain-containing protein n=1 Tax=Aspergillus bertholletiae TaxID=1226010 RepID=A0A5N7BE47_9EURO|nr:hypothetical protein BDV26DRAFT_152936 [Aspergillus bertholletiae]